MPLFLNLLLLKQESAYSSLFDIMTLTTLAEFSYALYSVSAVFELSKRRWGGRNFSLGGGVERRGGGVEFFFDTGWKKRWGLNFIINYRRERLMTINQIYGVSLLLEIGSKEAHTVCHSNI